MEQTITITYFQYECTIYKSSVGLWKIGSMTSPSFSGETKSKNIKKYINFLTLVEIKLGEMNDDL